MSGATGVGTTYNLPNYAGELFQISKEDTPFLSAIGGLTGGESAGSTLIEWQTEDLRDADITRQRLEGAPAPGSEERARSRVSNVLEIHQEVVELSYTRQATNRMRNTDGEKLVTIGTTTLPEDELQHQIDLTLKQVARDVNKSFIQGVYANPTTNTAPRKTRGLVEAITTNVVTATSANLTEDLVLDTLQKVWENGGIREGETRTILVGAKVKRALSKVFIKDNSYRETSRAVGGVNVTAIETDFGTCNIMLDNDVPADTLLVVSLEECSPVFLEIPGKGTFFAESLGRTGSSDKVQIYGEIGLKYGAEQHHGKLKLKAS
jgi:hypothetical protein